MISTPAGDAGFGFLLGTEYERRKQKLQRELQLDYTRHVSQKKPLKPGEAPSPPEALSLPIDDNTSVKEKLRDERKKEYNLFLQTQAQIRKFKRSSSPSCTPEQVQHSSTLDFPSEASPYSPSGRPPPPEDTPPSRRDAATLTESVDLGKHSQAWAPHRRQRRRWRIDRPREAGYSEEELNTEEDEESDFRCRTRKDRHPGERPLEEWRRRGHEERASQHMKGSDSHTAPQQSSNGRILESDLLMTSRMRTTPASAPRISQQKPEVVTGLMIGANEEQSAAQERKERYKQELLKQMAEQKRNKIKEKTLELRVAATGATDPEKDPDRIKHFGAVNWQRDGVRQDVTHKSGKNREADGKAPDPKLTDKKPNERSGASHVDPSAALGQLPGRRRERPGVPSLDYFSEDYHKDFSIMLGDMAVPRVAAFDPLIPPSVPETYKTPHDAAYYYYGARNPVEPRPPSDSPSGGDGQSGNVVSPPQRTPRLKSRFHLESAPEHGASPLAGIELHQDRQRRESPQSYQEALRQQIKEREEQRRREKVKVAAEVLPYDPWGRGGCGAPITDHSGDILCDLKKMRRFNEEPSRNHALSPITAPPSHQSPAVAGLRNEPSQPKKYMEALKEQMEVNRRRQEEERERIRMEEENEEKRLAVQRASILQEYEQEKQREQRRIELCRPQKQNSTIQYKMPTRREKLSEEVPHRSEEKQPQLASKREASPPIPTLQKKLTDVVESRTSSAESRFSSRTERFVSAPQQRANSAGAPQTQEGQQEVIRVLSNLRRHLSKEQKQLELQLGRRSPEEPPYSAPTRWRLQADTSEVAHRKAVEKRDGRPLRATTYVNKDNIREFTQLKSRDTDSREEVRAMFPDPPTDARTLDIQQQALLRQQQHKIRRMNQQKRHDFLDDEHSRKHGHPLHSDRSLPSATTFIALYGDDGYEPSAERRDPAAKWRSRNRDEPADCVETQSLQSATSHKSCHSRAPDQQRALGQDGDHHGTGWPCDDDGGLDVSSLRSVLDRPPSLETVATEPWLRPGSSEAVKQDVRSSLILEFQPAALRG